MTTNKEHINNYAFLADAGEIGELIKQFDWFKTCIGAIDSWPISLQVTLNNMLHNAFPMFLFWGKDFLCFYNEAFRPSFGAEGKHPAIGKKAISVWGEVWDIIGPLIQQVYITRKPVWFEDMLVPFYRDGKVQDIYWTFAYSPAFNENAEVDGVLVTCMETTKHVLARKDRLNPE